MTTYSSEPLAQRCCYMLAGVYCQNGLLYRYRRPDQGVDTDGVIAEAELLEGVPLQCPLCEGKAMLLTNKGRELLAFMEVFGRPFLRDLVDEFHEEREQH
jgi:hypothetical protein